MTNVEMIEEMLDMQKALDKEIYEKKGVEFNKDKCFMALIDEIGEFTHEIKILWCWWKDNCKEVDEAKVLEELVDIWHFVLSMCNHDESKRYTLFLSLLSGVELKEQNTDDVFLQETEDIKTNELLIKILEDNTYSMLDCVCTLAYKVRYTIADVYEAYKKKNSVNYERLKNGY